MAKKRHILAASMVLILVLGACSATPSGIPTEDLQHPTSLRRYNGVPITLAELRENRDGALSVARALARLDRELREQEREDRGVDVFLEGAARRNGPDLRTAQDLWAVAERPAFGAGREIFHEYGVYRGEFGDEIFSPRGGFGEFRDEAARLLHEHADFSPKGQLLAAWRRFAPRATRRAPGYLAGTWRFELSARGHATVRLSDSLLGPFARCAVEHAGDAFLGGAPVTRDGYMLSQGLLDLVADGPGSPVGATIAALALVVKGQDAPLPVSIEEGYVRLELTREDREFLVSALDGLANGCCDVDGIPLSCTRFEVTFSYLVGRNEARATLGFGRAQGGWTLHRFIYEPAAASVMRRRGISLDLLAMVSAAAQTAGSSTIAASRRR